MKDDRIITKVQEGMFKKDTLKESGLDPLPRMYDSLSNNPVAEIIRNSENVYNNIFRLIRFVDVEVTVPVAVFDPFFFTLTPGTVTYTGEHRVRGSRIPFVEIYTDTVQESVVIPNASTNETTFSGTVYNYDEVSSPTITIRAYIYEILYKFQ